MGKAQLGPVASARRRFAGRDGHRASTHPGDPERKERRRAWGVVAEPLALERSARKEETSP